jgi:hypothetical protein
VTSRKLAGILGLSLAAALPTLQCGVPDIVLDRGESFGGICGDLYADRCGAPCERDQQCGDGLYCNASSECAADCGPGVGCSQGSTCTANGRCEIPVSTATTGASNGSGGTGSIIVTTTGAGAGGEGGSEECAAVLEEATEVKRPMDIVVTIDNSASMEGEIVAVQERINSEFAAIIEDSGIDFRVIMVTRYGNVFIQNEDGGQFQDSSFGVCIGAPLSTLECPTDETEAAPPVAHNSPAFFHHSTDVGSRNLWCRLLESFDASDPYPNPRTNWTPVAPDGWREFLREDAFKVFVAITDDSPSTMGIDACEGTDFSDDAEGALAFDETIRALAPEHFGAFDADDPADGRNYAWYSIVGMAGNDQAEPTPLAPDEPVETSCCQGDGSVVDCPSNNNAPVSDGVRAGVGYQELSRMTGALRYPSCYNDNFDDVFNAIAEGVIEGAKLSCEWAIPDPPQGEVFDKDKVNVEYHPGDGSEPVAILKVPSLDDCGDSGGWYYDDEDAPTVVRTCPSTCAVISADPAGSIGVLFGCETQIEVVE